MKRVDRDAVDRWLQAYIEAWKTYDREKISALFADDVRYRYHPYDDPIEGREAVVASWLEEGDEIVKTISGSYSNVVGLPLERLKEELAEWSRV